MSLTTRSSLDRRVVLKSNQGTTSDSYGHTVEDWTEYAKAWANVKQPSGREFMAASGPQSERKVVFRIRWRDDVTVEHRVEYGGRDHNINEVREIGRGRWLDLHTTAVG